MDNILGIKTNDTFQKTKIDFINKELHQIKKMFGEEMMHFCRSNFSSILETNGLLTKLLLEHFNLTKFLYQDIVKENKQRYFIDYINCLIKIEETKPPTIDLPPEELMRYANYTLYECHTEKEIQSFKKYYEKKEELCTFKGKRLDTCYVYFAVKDNVESIKRSEIPDREDEYGTSVISIQFSKDPSHHLSIKNRYNHTVANPDNTYSNNLDNIVYGLTESFSKYKNMKQTKIDGQFELKGYVLANDNKYYKYNYEINNIYYCPDNIIINNFDVIKFPKEKYIVTDYFIIDLVNKTINLYDEKIKDSFPEIFRNIKKITILNKNDTREITILNEENQEVIITINKENKIVSLIDNYIDKIEDNFLLYSNSIKIVELNSVLTIGNYFINTCKTVENISLKAVIKINNFFMVENRELKNISFENLEQTGFYFLENNKIIENVELPKLQIIGIGFLENNQNLTKLSLPEAKFIDSCFITNNKNQIQEIDLPKVIEIKGAFLSGNTTLIKIYAPNLKKVGSSFLRNNTSIKILALESLEIIEDNFLEHNDSIEEVYLPLLKQVRNNFIKENTTIKIFEASNLERVGDNFLERNKELTELGFKYLKEVGNNFLRNNNKIKNIDFQSLEIVGNYFLYWNQELIKVILKNLQRCGYGFIEWNEKIEVFIAPSLTFSEDNFLENNKNLLFAYIPNDKDLYAKLYLKKIIKNKVKILIYKR